MGYRFSRRQCVWGAATLASPVLAGGTPAVLRSSQANDPWTRLAVSGDGRRLAAGSDAHGKVQVWDWPARRELTLFDTGARSVRSLSWDRSGQQLVVTNSDGKVAVWTAEGRRLSEIANLGFGAEFALISPLGDWIALGMTEQELRVVRREGSYLTRISGWKGRVRSMALSSDGRYLAAASERDRSPTVFDTRTWQRVVDGAAPNAQATQHRWGIDGLSFSQDGDWLLSRDLQGGLLLRRLPNGPVTPMPVNGETRLSELLAGPDHLAVVVAGSARLQIRRAGRWEQIALPEIGHPVSLTFSPDGRWWLVGGNGAVAAVPSASST